MNKCLPHSEECEQELLCSLLLDPGPVSRLCFNRLPRAAFYIPAHQIIFDLIVEWDQPDQPVAFTWLCDKLKALKQLEEVGGKNYLSKIAGFAPTAANAKFDLEIILEKYRRREAILFSNRVSQLCYDEREAINGAFTDLEREFSEIVHSTNGVSLLKGASLLDYSKRTINDSDTLLGERYLCRGGGMFIVAPSGIGKSVLATQFAIELAIGRRSFGINPSRPLRSLLIQAEDDEGDTIEMSRIIEYLNLSDEQKQLVQDNTWIEFLNDRTGIEFLATLDGFLGQRPVDLVLINPYTSYLGGDIKDDKVNTIFLRNGLNPILTKHRCAAVIIHHTPKTNFRDTTDWKPSDWMYSGAGAAVLTNWARAYLVIDPCETRELFKFIAAKRGQRIGWGEHTPVYERFFAHSQNDGELLWIPASEDQIAADRENSKKTPEDLLRLIPVLDPLLQEKLFLIAKQKGISEKRTRAFLKILIDDGKVHEHKIPRPGVKSAKGYAQQPPTGEE